MIIDRVVSSMTAGITRGDREDDSGEHQVCASSLIMLILARGKQGATVRLMIMSRTRNEHFERFLDLGVEGVYPQTYTLICELLGIHAWSVVLTTTTVQVGSNC